MGTLTERYAELLTDYCVRVAPGDRVLLSVDTAALDLARALCRAVLAAGGEPFLRLQYPEAVADVIELASDELLASEAVVQLREIELMQAYVRVAAQENSRVMAGADQSRLARLEKRLAAAGRHRVERTRWVTTLYPTPAAAQEAGMSTDAYRRFVYDAMFLYDDDPSARWRELGERQQLLVDRLNRADEVRLEGPGTDLRLRVRGRTWANSDGRRNMPSGEVFTSPLEDSAEGVVRFTVPSQVRGSVVEDVSLRFEAGRVVEATARQGQELLDGMLATDEGARYLGEIGIGTNPHIRQPTLKTLFDEKILGTVHLALGRSYESTGGRNDSAIHWDLVCDLREGGRVTVDGEPFLEDGRLLWLD
ncbi:MAG TPA: aminopeptidase [Trueperaceae bacterium]|nr:aminopeptidase [Trueperaceae bacterium]